jgi:hypothetical protein
MLLVLAASLVIFHVPFEGSFWLLTLASLLFILTTLGAGLFISTISRTRSKPTWRRSCFQPFMMLSGFTFRSAACRRCSGSLFQSDALFSGGCPRNFPQRLGF